MKTYKVFTEKYSKIYQADGIESVIRKHHKVSNDEIVAVTIADRPDLLSKVEQLEPKGECPTCDGLGEWSDENRIHVKCNMCKGTGKLTPQQPSDSAGEETFPTWREAMDGITDSRIKGDFKDMNIYQSGARIMYDRLYTMLYNKLTRPTVSEEERTEAEKHEILQGFCEKISKQQDISPEFAAIVQRHFWDLI